MQSSSTTQSSGKMFKQWQIRSLGKEKVGKEKIATKEGTRDRTRGREDTRERTRTRGDTKGDTRERTRTKESTYKGKGNPQNPFVASAQAYHAAAAAQAGPPYEFRGWGPALQAAAPTAAAAAAAAAPVSADERERERERERDAKKGGQKGQKGQTPVTPQKKVAWQDYGVNRAANQQREWE